MNWPQNDDWLGPLVGPGVTPQQADREIARAKQLSLSLLYWLQTECPRPDGKAGWKGLRLRPDLVGTTDGLAKAPYIRESRRIKAEFTVLEQHVGHRGPAEEAGQGRGRGRIVPGQRRRGQLPDRSAPQHRRNQLHRHQLAAVPGPPGRPDSPPGREPAAGLQEPRARPTSPTAATGSIRWSGPSARRRGLSWRSAGNRGSRHEACGTRRPTWPPSSPD